MLRGIFIVLKASARDEILANGGSISHHHGGKFGILGMISCMIKVVILSKFLLRRVKIIQTEQIHM